MPASFGPVLLAAHDLDSARTWFPEVAPRAPGVPRRHSAADSGGASESACHCTTPAGAAGRLGDCSAPVLRIVPRADSECTALPTGALAGSPVRVHCREPFGWGRSDPGWHEKVCDRQGAFGRNLHRAGGWGRRVSSVRCCPCSTWRVRVAVRSTLPLALGDPPRPWLHHRASLTYPSPATLTGTENPVATRHHPRADGRSGSCPRLLRGVCRLARSGAVADATPWGAGLTTWSPVAGRQWGRAAAGPPCPYPSSPQRDKTASPVSWMGVLSRVRR